MAKARPAPREATAVRGGNRCSTTGRLTVMRSRVRIISLVVVSVAAAGGCGGEAAGTLSNSTTTPSRSTSDEGTSTSVVGAASTPPTEAARVDVWEQSTTAVVTAGIATAPDTPSEVYVSALASTSVGYLAAGSVNRGFVVWRSADLGAFEPIYTEICCERSFSAVAIGELREALVIGGNAMFGAERRQQALLLASDDGASSWRAVGDPGLGSGATRLDRMIVTDDAILVEAAADTDPDVEPQQIVVWSEDLETWHAVELPGRGPGDRPWFVHGGGAIVFALSQRYDGPEGRFSETAIWRSDDGGRQFTEQPSLLEPGVGDFLAVGDTLVGLPYVSTSDDAHADPPGRFVLAAGGEWRELGPDTGTWGDGRVAVFRTAVSGTAGRAYALAARTMRSSPHYCYDDVDTCRQGELAVLATDDGVTWREVPGYPGLGLADGPVSMTVNGDGEVVFLGVDGGGSSGVPIYVTRSTGGAAPPEIENPDLPPPDIPVALVGHTDPFEIGDERRYVLGLGGCAGMYLDDQRWLPETPLPDPPPPEWPHRAVDIADGPTGYVYGRVSRLDADTIQFSIEGLGPVATFHPGPMPEYACG